MPRAMSGRGRAVDVRRCAHVGGSVYVVPSSTTGCRRCRDHGERWIALWMCLSCGWVACSDDSPNRHARAHYEETNHPVAVRLPRGSPPRWCYVHQRAV